MGSPQKQVWPPRRPGYAMLSSKMSSGQVTRSTVSGSRAGSQSEGFVLWAPCWDLFLPAPHIPSPLQGVTPSSRDKPQSPPFLHARSPPHSNGGASTVSVLSGARPEYTSNLGVCIINDSRGWSQGASRPDTHGDYLQVPRLPSFPLSMQGRRH